VDFIFYISLKFNKIYLFPNREIFTFAKKNNHKAMKQIFEVEFLPKAVEFLENLDEKTREKAEEIRKQYMNNKINKK